MKIPFYILLILVFLLSACNNNYNIHLVNKEADLPASFKFDSLGLKVMASFINKRSATMSIMYANTLALKNVIKGDKKHSAGEVIALITWKQKDDGHWFGARIPGALQYLELIKMTGSTNGLITTYTKYCGKNLLAQPEAVGQKDRIAYILARQPSVMP